MGTEQERAKWREKSLKWYYSHKNNPEWMGKHRAYAAAQARKRRAEADPEIRAKQLEKKNIYSRIRRAKIKTEDPDHYRQLADRGNAASMRRYWVKSLDPEWRKTQSDKVNERNKKNRDKINAYKRHKKLIDPNFKFAERVRSRISMALNGVAKYGRMEELIGCSMTEFRAHLEQHFGPGMTWDNYGFGDGKWNMDHERPCASFDLSRPEEQKKCFHFSNTKPIWHRENVRKSSIVNGRKRYYHDHMQQPPTSISA